MIVQFIYRQGCRAQLAGMQIVKQWLLSEENLQVKNT